MTRTHPRTTLAKLITEYASTPMEPIERHHRFIDDLGYDSLSVVELLIAVEEEFGLEQVELTEVRDIATVAALEQLVDTRLQDVRGAK